MLTLTPENAVPYLHFNGHWPAHVPAQARMLAGGVSNTVIRVEPLDPRSEYPPMILKQSAELLRTQMEWRSRKERIWIETEAMQFLDSVLPPGVVPRVIFEDRPQYIFGMTDLGQNCDVWKLLLLEGRPNVNLARNAGRLLGMVHESGLRNADRIKNSILGDLTVFNELRIDPYYKTVSRAHPVIADAIDELIKTMLNVSQKTLVLGDFSPKNILVDGHDQLALVDFETSHWGDPAFDLGFFLTHLVLKMFRAMRLGMPAREEYLSLMIEFWGSYRRTFLEIDDPRNLESRTVSHLAACMLARVDGKSPVDYLCESDQDAVRSLTIEALKGETGGLGDFFANIKEHLQQEQD